MKVTFLQTVSSMAGSWATGDSADLDAGLAKQWASVGIVTLLESGAPLTPATNSPVVAAPAPSVVAASASVAPLPTSRRGRSRLSSVDTSSVL